MLRVLAVAFAYLLLCCECFVARWREPLERLSFTRGAPGLALILFDETIDLARRPLLLHRVDLVRVLLCPFEECLGATPTLRALDVPPNLVEHAGQIRRKISAHLVIGFGLALATRTAHRTK